MLDREVKIDVLYIEIIKKRNGKVSIDKYDSILDYWKDWFKVKYGTSWKMKLIKWIYKPIFDKDFRNMWEYSCEDKS